MFHRRKGLGAIQETIETDESASSSPQVLVPAPMPANKPYSDGGKVILAIGAAAAMALIMFNTKTAKDRARRSEGVFER